MLKYKIVFQDSSSVTEPSSDEDWQEDEDYVQTKAKATKMRKGVSKLRLALNQPIKFPKIKKSQYEKFRDDNIKHKMDILASLKLKEDTYLNEDTELDQERQAFLA